jgi:hypothetical protein
VPSETIHAGAYVNNDYLQEARKELAKQLAMPDVPPLVWDELVEYNDDLIRHAYPHGDKDEWDDLKRKAREIMRLSSGRAGHKSPPGRLPGEERPTWQLKEEELERSWAFSEYVSRIAHTESNVRRFRSRYLGGQTIHPHRARALLTSPAAAIWPSLEFKVAGFSMLDHTHHVVEEGHDDRGPYSLVEAHDAASGIRKRFKDRRPLQAGAWSVAERAKDALSDSEDAHEVKGWKLLSFPDEEDGIHRVCVKTGSILGELRNLSDKLIQRYPWWESETVWFVLTGATPWVAPVSLQARGIGHSGLFERQFVTIKAEPWVSEETIRRTYREAQIRLLQGDNRRTKDKQIKLFRFISARIHPCGIYREERAKAAKALMSEWDQENPDDAYGTDTRRFWRDYDRALLLVARPMEAAEQRERERASRERRRRKW